MMENQKFTYTYSAAIHKEVMQIREKYISKEESKLDMLKRLDKAVQNAGMTEGLTIGILGVLIFGVGMCMGLNVLGGGIILASVICLLGTLIMIPAYPVYRILARRAREQYVPQILRLTDELEKNV